MSQLCKHCSEEKEGAQWLPVTLKSFEDVLLKKIKGGSPAEITKIKDGKAHKQIISNPNNYEYGLRKNICYVLQYLEYLLETNEQLKLTTALTFLNYKAFTIFSASILEGILFHELKSKGLNKKTNLASLGKTSATKGLQEKTFIFQTEIFEQVSSSRDEQMTFDQMLSIVEAKKLLGEEHEIYGNIKIIRKLRNKIHIHIAESRHETDYNSFSYQKLGFAKITLLNVLKGYFDLTDHEIDTLFKFLKPKDIDTVLTIKQAEESGFI